MFGCLELRNWPFLRPMSATSLSLAVLRQLKRDFLAETNKEPQTSRLPLRKGQANDPLASLEGVNPAFLGVGGDCGVTEVLSPPR